MYFRFALVHLVIYYFKVAKLQFPKTGRLLLIGNFPSGPPWLGAKGENFDFGGTQTAR